MRQVMPFGDILDAADELSLEEQQALVDIVHRRIVEQGRKMLAEDIQDARKEFAEGKCRPVTTNALMKEILS